MTTKTTPSLTHVDADGHIAMVDTSDKPVSKRIAKARGVLVCSEVTRDLIFGGGLKKGDAVTCAKIAGIMAAKKTSELIPLCHPVALTDVDVVCSKHADGVEVLASATCVAQTGVEMEALTACTTALLCLYDMAKAVEKTMRIHDVRLVEKRGGRSGDFVQP